MNDDGENEHQMSRKRNENRNLRDAIPENCENEEIVIVRKLPWEIQ